jgi:hypothetical protein
MRQGEAMGGGDGYRMKITAYSPFSTLWKNISRIFHAMENIFPQYGKQVAFARTSQGRYQRSAPIPAQPSMEMKMENKAVHRTTHKLRHLHAFATITPVAASTGCVCAPSGDC